MRILILVLLFIFWGCQKSTNKQDTILLPARPEIPNKPLSNKEGHGGDGVICFKSIGRNSAALMTKMFKSDYQQALKQNSNVKPALLLKLKRQIELALYVRLYDFWENRQLNNFQYRQLVGKPFVWKRDSGLNQLKDSIRSEKPGLAASVDSLYQSVLSRLSWKPVVPEVDDMGTEPDIPKHCALVQLARYTPNGRIEISKLFYPYLNANDRKGLFFHESLQAGAHWLGYENSIKVRELTRGLALPLFSGDLPQLDLKQKLHRIYASLMAAILYHQKGDYDWEEKSLGLVLSDLSSFLNIDPWSSLENLNHFEAIYIAATHDFSPEVVQQMQKTFERYRRVYQSLRNSRFSDPIHTDASFMPATKRAKRQVIKRFLVVKKILKTVNDPLAQARNLNRQAERYIELANDYPKTSEGHKTLISQSMLSFELANIIAKHLRRRTQVVDQEELQNIFNDIDEFRRKTRGTNLVR